MDYKLPDIGQLKLQRYPPTSDKSLRAWSAADEYLLSYLEENFSENLGRLLIINDQFGALTVSLDQFSPYIWSDSYLSQAAISKNLNQNIKNSEYEIAPKFLSLDIDSNDLISQLTLDETPITHQEKLDTVLIRIPKHNSLLELQLQVLNQYTSEHTKIIASGMTKEIHNSTLALFEKYLGPTKTSLARKKARLIFSEFTDKAPTKLSLKNFRSPKQQLLIQGLPGVFSREKLDIGARVLLEYLPQVEPETLIADLGCGNGVLGATIASQQTNSRVVLCDESALAVASAKLTFSANQLDNGIFYHTNVFDQVNEKNFNYILCNPPFHQQNVQTLAIAKQMFKASSKKLATDGELLVVANRHLKYGPVLSSYFQKVKPISKDPKFIVWRATLPIK